MKLNVMERLICQNLLPAEANYATLKIMRKAREALSFTDEQAQALKFYNSEDKSGWDGKAAQEIGEEEIKLGVTPTKAIISALKALEEEENPKTKEIGMLKPEHESLYEKFIIQDPLAAIEDSSKIIPTDKSKEVAACRPAPEPEETEPE